MRELHCKHLKEEEPHLVMRAVLESGEDVAFLFCVECLNGLTFRNNNEMLPVQYLDKDIVV